MKPKSILISALILGLSLLISLYIASRDRKAASTESGEQHSQEAEKHQELPRGPHRGRMLEQDGLHLEVAIYESGVPPEFRVYPSWQDKPLPPQSISLTASVVRLGKTDRITFQPEQDYWRSQQEIYEPHSFTVQLKAVYQGQSYQFEFEQTEGRLELSPEVVRRSQIEILKAGPRTLRQVIRLPGKIAMAQDAQVHLTPKVSGVVRNVYKHIGEPVRAGELLAVLDSRELADAQLDYRLARQKYQQAQTWLKTEQQLTARTRRLVALLKAGKSPDDIHRQLAGIPIGANKSRLLSAYSEYNLARQHLEREQTLLQPPQVTSTADYQEARKNYQSAQAVYTGTLEEIVRERELAVLGKRQARDLLRPELDISSQKLRILGIPAGQNQLTRYELRSPIAGVVVEKHLAIGEKVSGNEAVYTLADLSTVWAEMMVPDQELDRVRLGQPVNIASQNKAYRGSGVISHVGPVVDEQTRTAESHAHIDNPNGIWRPGMFITVELVKQARRVPVAVPLHAIQTFRDWSVVFAKFGNQFEVRPLELGEQDEEWAEVKSGLQAGQLFAGQNSFILKAELGKAGAAHDH